MADIKSAPSRQITGSSDGRTHDAIHVKQSPPPHLYQPRTSISSSPASEVLSSSSRSPSFTSTGTVPAATSVSSPVTLGATTKTARSTTKKKHPTTSTKDTSTAMTTISSPSIKEGTTPTQRISRAKKGKRVHACNHPSCDKVFTRAEHLRRHQLNHNTDVLYKCEMCERTFVRQDLLSRHTERHATQAMKAVQTLALARNTGFAARYGINGISGMSTRPAPTSDYGGNAHVFDSNPHSTPRVHTDMNALPQILTSHSPHQSTPSASSLVTPHSSNSMTSYASGFSPSMSISNSADSQLDYSAADANSPSGLRRAHLPFHLQHSEPQRQSDHFIATSHPEIMQRPPTLSMDHHLYAKPMPTWENYAWLFDDSTSQDQSIIEMNSTQNTGLPFLNPLETTHYQNVAMNCDPSFHQIDDTVRSQVLMLLGNIPNLHTSDCTSASSMQQYLRNYWTKFHPLFPVLHRPTFVPSLQLVMLVAIVIALGASFASDEDHQFGMMLYDKVKGLILNSDEFSTHNSNSTYLQQTILLTDIFGKMKCTRPQFDGAPLDVILMKLLRRSEIPTTDPLEQIKRYHRAGLELNYDNEWQNWIDLESRKRVALLFFYWDVQQATIFGREMCQTAFDHRVYLPCEEFVWNANTSQEWMGYLDGQMEILSFLETLRIFLDPKRQFPVLSPLSSMFILHGLISVGFDLHRRSSPIGPSPEETAAKQARLLRAYEKWATYYNINVSPHLSQITNDQNMVMYHSAYISLHTNIHNLITTAGDSRIFKRISERDEHRGAKFEIQQWANTAAAKLATWHAVQILVRSLGRPQLYLEHFHVPWSMYVATLVCWTYGQFSTSAVGPGVQAPEDEVIWDAHQDMGHYLRLMNTGNWEDLVHVRGQTRTAGLLTVVQSSIEGIRWGLIQESVEVLKRLNAPRTSKSV